MTDKCAADGSYRIIYLQELLDRRFSAGTTQVICPITDAFVGHHGSLGGFLPVYCSVDDGSGSCDPISLRKIGVSASIRYSILSSPE